MNLALLLQKLSYGHLSDLSIAGEGSGVVPVANIPKLVMRVEDALVQLYTRFPLQLRTLVLETVSGLYHYTLTAPFAQTSGSTELNKYIKDTVAMPFLDDVLLVTAVLGNEATLPKTPYFTPHGKPDDNNYRLLPLDDTGGELSWFNTSYDTLSMDYPVTGDRYLVQYRAKHARLELQPADPTAVDIRVPSVLENALLSYVAAKVYSGMGGTDAALKTKQLMDEFERDCRFHEDRGTFQQVADYTNTKAMLGGWV